MATAVAEDTTVQYIGIGGGVGGNRGSGGPGDRSGDIGGRQ